MAKKVKAAKGATAGISVAEAEENIVSLANAGHSSSHIGIVLRDEYGVKDFHEFSGKGVQQVLAEHKLSGEMPEDMLNLIRRSVQLFNHMARNKKDFSAKRGYELTVSKIRRLTKYYAKKGKIPAGWKYTPEQAALLVK